MLKLLFFLILFLLFTTCNESVLDSKKYFKQCDTLVYEARVSNKPDKILYLYNHSLIKTSLSDSQELIFGFLYDSNPYFIFDHFRKSHGLINIYLFECCSHFYLDTSKTEMLMISFIESKSYTEAEEICFRNNFLTPFLNDTFTLNRYPSNLKSPNFFNDYTKEDSLRLIDHVEFFKSSLVRDTVLLEYNNYTLFLDKKTKVQTKVMYIKRNLKVNEVANARKEYRNSHKITFLFDGFSFQD